MKILLVEDSPVNQLVTSALLETIGVEHSVVDNGLLAFDLLINDKQHDIGLILMDCHMPLLNGFKASKLIRRGYADADHKITPIVALTGNSDEEVKLMCLEAGMNGFLSKPVDPEELGSTIHTLMR
ncbi:hypothetical protein A3715_04930 [Oleiphilus sp. HI0009]|nr:MULTISPECIES: response regulator [unclassified Oleiphilus]KZX83447.1 hypothetical protein A3715_04930 [Oleiphilus sp. HI0009]KZY65033.1 hypothetical protein A3738_09225 [Oleiphilus sp. HI0066]KZY71431.1 hypothetical protein A3739_05005 [Oleiphilus sp. HI0067]